jgi:hypothetical protein
MATALVSYGLTAVCATGGLCKRVTVYVTSLGVYSPCAYWCNTI